MIDAHVHVWRIGANGCVWPTADLAAIHRDFGLADFAAEPGADAADGLLLVQSQEDPADTRWLLELAAQDPLVSGVIGWADLRDAEIVIQLAVNPKLCGIRPMAQDRPADWFDDSALDEGLAAMATHGLVLDALIRPEHLASLDRLAARHPGLTIVIDHAAKPDFDALSEWRDAVERIAARRNVACKLSGLLTELRRGAAADSIAPAVAIIRAAFGPDRLIWGSDWPVVTLVSSYSAWLDQARALVPRIDHDVVFGGNAVRLYRLAA